MRNTPPPKRQFTEQDDFSLDISQYMNIVNACIYQVSDYWEMVIRLITLAV